MINGLVAHISSLIFSIRVVTAASFSQTSFGWIPASVGRIVMQKIMNAPEGLSSFRDTLFVFATETALPIRQ
jgi:hypothetical protein